MHNPYLKGGINISEEINGVYIQKIRIRMGHDILSSVELVQGDSLRELHFFFDDGYIVPVDSELRVYIQKPSGLEIYNYCGLRNNEILVKLTQQMTAEYGRNSGQIQIIRNGEVITTFVFLLNIKKSLIVNSSITSSSEFQILDDLINQSRQLHETMQDTLKVAETQEAERVAAERERTTSENDRITEENIRIANETARKDAENKRKNAEKNRTTNESERISAENLRESNTVTAIDNCNNAVERVNEVLKKLNAAIDAVINDDSQSNITTFSSEKIASLFVDIADSDIESIFV